MQILKKIIKFLLSKTGYSIIPSQAISVEEPIREYSDQQKIVGDKEVTIFDVGAHQGQTSTLYNNLFKNATIYSFEPSPEAFEVLKKTCEAHKNITPFNIALSNTSGSVKFHLNQSSQTNSLLKTDDRSDKTWPVNLLNTKETINIDCVTIDDFVTQNNISHIDILKLDTQGTEYQIIEGAAQTIALKKIKLIYLEIITMPTYSGQKHFDEVLYLLRSKGFQLFNLYNYSYTEFGELRQVDAIFIYNYDFL